MYRASHTGFPRVPLVQACSLTIGDVTSTGVLCNISQLGLFVDVEPMPAAGSEGLVRFFLPDLREEILTPVRVMWVNDEPPEEALGMPRGCGLRFLGLSAAEVRRIAAFVDAFVADPRPPGVDEQPPRSTRVPFVAPCAVSAPRGVLKGRLCNLSSRGVFVAVDPVPRLGTLVILAFDLPGHEGLFERAGVVAWRNVDGEERVRSLPLGAGIRFANLTKNDEKLLASIVDEYLAGLPTLGG